MTKQQTGRFDEKTTAQVIGQLGKALAYLHGRNIIHRDIKPENILLDSDGNIKLADFGWSNYEDKMKKRETYCGTLDYLAPEMADSSHQHDYRVDIWSVGVLIYELLAGFAPFSPNKPGPEKLDIEKETKMNILSSRMNFPKDFPPLAKDLIKKILVVNPDDRYSIDQIMAHPWMQQQYKEKAAGKPNFNTLDQTPEFMDMVRQQRIGKVKEDPNYLHHPGAFTEDEAFSYIRPASLLLSALAISGIKGGVGVSPSQSQTDSSYTQSGGKMFLKPQKTIDEVPSYKKSSDAVQTEYDALADQLINAKAEIAALKLEVDRDLLELTKRDGITSQKNLLQAELMAVQDDLKAAKKSLQQSQEKLSAVTAENVEFSHSDYLESPDHQT